MTMADLKVGEMARISGYMFGNAAYRAKLLALGLTHGTSVKLVNQAPLGDPIELAVRGYHLSLRREEAKVVRVERLTVEQARKERP